MKEATLSASPADAPASDQATPEVSLLNSAVQGAHARLDRLAERAEPAVRQLGDTLTAAEQALQDKTRQLRATGDTWADGMRSSVRGKPLLWMAAAFAVGAAIVRLTR